MDLADDGQGHPSHSQESPSYDDLESLLLAELARLGKDPSSTTSSAPTGDVNAVFDLAAAITDPDGVGGDPPTAITLTWTEQLCGDYNQDGLVTANDLTPLGQNWEATVEYDAPELHGGFAYWPVGDPDDPAEGGTNWRLARVDGNQDGQIYQYDITPIGVHWQERLSHYRVYVKAPGDGGFSLTETLSPQRTNKEPVRLGYEYAVPAGGKYAFYVAPFDDSTSGEGPASNVLYVDADTGIANQAPVAKLTVTPEFAGAPAEITLDASASYDTDGAIAAFQWDFDADGVVDWTSTDAVPEASSTGTVDMITPGAGGVVTVSYNQGSADWYYPSVMVVDDDGAESAVAKAKLGISGWELEIIFTEDDEIVEGFYARELAVDPNTGEAIVYGPVAPDDYLYLLRRTSPGQWQAEKCFEDTDPLYQDYLGDLPGKLLDSWLRWQDNGEPIMFFNARKGKMETTSRAFVSRRTGGNWELSELYIGTEPRLDASINSVQQVGPDHWRMTAADNVGTPSDIYLLDYDHGSISLSDPEVPLERTEEKLQTYLEYRIDDQGDNYFRMIDMGKDQYGVWWPLINLSPEVRLWQGNAAAGWEMVVHDYSHLWSTEDFEVKAMLITGSDERVFTVDHYVYTGETVVKTGLYFILDTGASSRLLQAFDEYEWGVSKVQSALGTYAVMSNYSYSLLENKMPGIRKMTRYVQLEPQRIIVEEVARVEDSAEFDSIGHTDWIMQDDGNAYCLLVGEGSIFNPPDQPDALIEGYALGIRVDPRLNN